MTIKEKFNERIDRIKAYKVQVNFYRNMVKELRNKQNDITAIVDADKVDETYACIKAYHTWFAATDCGKFGEEVYFHTKNCHRFDEKPCPIFNCPYNARHKQYQEQERLLHLAQKNKHLAFERIFERIR